MPTIREKILRQEISRLRDELEGLRQEISRLQSASTSYHTSPDHDTTMLRVNELYWTVTRIIGLSHLHDGSRRASVTTTDTVPARIGLRIKELYWTVTRFLGLAHLHDGSRSASATTTDTVPARIGLRIKELYWTVTRFLGLAHLHDGSRRASVATTGGDQVSSVPIEAVPPWDPTQTRLGKEILVVANHLPLFDQASGCLRLKSIIAILGGAGWSITFGSLMGLHHQPGILATSEGRRRYEQTLAAVGVNGFLYGPEEIDGFLRDRGRCLDWVFLCFPDVAKQFMPLVRSRCPAARIAYDMVDFHALRILREAELRADSELHAKATQQRAEEIACALAADVTFAVSENEKAALLELAPTAVVEVLTNVFEVPTSSIPGPHRRRGLLFVGGFWHRPNGDAVHWFAERIFPSIREAVPDVTFSIAGANPDAEVLALGSRPGIEVLGYVPDLTSVFDSHRVFVAPLRYGAGMIGKVGQSMSLGLPVVTTPIGAEGMKLKNQTQVLIASDEQAFAAQVLRLLSDDELWLRLSVAGREHIERTLSVDVVRSRLEAVIDG
jgi:O-antigen biosynthesis protein